MTESVLNKLALERADYNVDAAREDDKPVFVWGFKDAHSIMQSEKQALVDALESMLTIYQKHASDDPYEDHIADYAKSLIETHKRSVTPKSEIE